MSRAFVPRPSDAAPLRSARRVFVTGAAGRIGRTFAQANGDRYDLTLMVRDDQVDAAAALEPLGRIVTADLADYDRLVHLMTGHDVVLHLAADPSPKADWNSLLPNNIVGTRNAYEAAAQAGCQRLIFASSVHAVLGYRDNGQIRPEDPVNPPDLYGVTKAFGEAYGRYIATTRDLSVIVVRIGAFADVQLVRDGKRNARAGDIFLSHEDLVHLLQCCIDDRQWQFAIALGSSANRFNFYDLADTCRNLGYQPQHDFYREHPELSKQFPSR